MAGLLIVVAVIFAKRRSDGPATIQNPVTPTTVAPRVAADVSWAAQYLGVQPGAATGTPYKIGWIGGDAETLSALTAVAGYLNANATGVGGRPIEFVSCDSSSGREQTCADEFATRNDFALVMSDMGAVNSKPFKTLAPSKAIELIGSSGSTAIGTDAYIFNTDGPSWYRLILSFAINFLPATVKNIVVVNDLGIGSFGSDQGELITTRPRREMSASSKSRVTRRPTTSLRRSARSPARPMPMCFSPSVISRIFVRTFRPLVPNSAVRRP